MMIIGVGPQSSLGGQDIFAGKLCMKNRQHVLILRDICPTNYQNARIFIFSQKK